MTTLTITAKGQVTLRKDILRHLGASPGDKVVVNELSDGRIEVSAVRPKGKISDVFDCLKREDARTLSIEEINEIVAQGWAGKDVRMTVDTNVLVRAIVGDDQRQSKIAKAQLARAEVVALAQPALCELVWVLSKGYGRRSDEIAAMLRRLINVANVAVDRQAANAGLDFLDAGGDFADGVIAHEGERLGGGVFVSFDRKATSLAKARGRAVLPL